MSFYIRKSFRAGPLRFNLSKSGLGVSAGFKGFRVGTGPRGNYVHMGRNGLYYRAYLPSSKKPNKEDFPVKSIESNIEMKEIESANIMQLQDSSSSTLLAEMNGKHSKVKLLPLVTILGFLALILLASLKLQVWAYIILILVWAVSLFLSHYRDKLAKTVVLSYELDSKVEEIYQSIHDAFNNVASCSQVWHISASGRIDDLNEWKRQAGANNLVRRHSSHPAIKSPPYTVTNISTPSIPLGKRTLYFFPERILVYEKGKVGAISYSEIQLEFGNTRFIESEQLPNDAQVVGQTWQYVNKDGSPDRRFNNNRQLPIALYSELHFKSSSGLNELIQLSRPDIGQDLLESMKKASLLQEGSK